MPWTKSVLVESPLERVRDRDTASVTNLIRQSPFANTGVTYRLCTARHLPIPKGFLFSFGRRGLPAGHVIVYRRSDRAN
jgi:hypothetical protein